MDGLPNDVCTEILDEILMDVEKTVLENEKVGACTKDVEEEEMIGLEKTAPNKSFESDDVFCSLFIMDVLEEAQKSSIEDEVEEDNTEEVLCTEILEDSEKLDEKNETVEANDLQFYSWYDLFKDAYGSWGRDENKTLDSSLFESAAEITEPNKDIPDQAEIFEGCLEDDDKKVGVKDIGCQKKAVQFDCCSWYSDAKTEIDPAEDVFDDPDNALSFDNFYKRFCDNLNLNEESKVEQQMEDNGGTSGVQTFDNEDIFNTAVDESENDEGICNTNGLDKPVKAQSSKKVKGESRRSARLSLRTFVDFGSVVKTEEQEGIKIVLRRSARLVVKRKKKGLEKEDGTGKKSKK